MTGVSSYKLSDGRVVDVPYEGLNDFEKSFPDARKLIKTTNNNQSLIPHILPDGETKFNVSVFDIDSFYKKYPFAKTINPEDQSFVDAYITKKPKENKVKISHFIKPEDLNGSEEDVVEALSVKLAEIGVYIEDPTDFFGESVFLAKTKDRDFIESAGAGYVESQLIDSGIKKEFILDSDDFNAEETASAMNSYLEKIYDPNFIKEAEKRSGKIYDDYKQATDTPKLSVESFKESYREEQIESFKRASSSNIKIRVPELKIINSNPEKLKEYNKWKKGEVLGEISEENLNAFQEEYYKKQNNYKSTEFTSNLNQQTRDDIYALSSKEKRAFDYNVENINKSIDSFNNDTNIFLSKIEEYNNDKTKYSSKELLREQYILQKRQSNMIDLHIKLNKQADYLPNALRDFGANYNRLEQLATGFKGVGLGIASGTTQALTSLALGRFIDPLEEFVRYKRDISKESEQYQRDIEISDIKNLNDIGRWGAGAITQMIPSVSMAFTGSAALPLFFASGFGDKGLEMAVNEADAITRIADNKKILEQNKNLSLEQKLIFCKSVKLAILLS